MISSRHVFLARHMALSFVALFVATFTSRIALAEDGSVTIGGSVKAFHALPWTGGKTLRTRLPENEHVKFDFYDLAKLYGIDDVLLLQSDGIRNALALVDGEGGKARRMILFDWQWMLQHSRARDAGEYLLVFAHEIGHHVCRHTVDIAATERKRIELEADAAGGAILRRAYDGEGINGAKINLDALRKLVRKYLAGPTLGTQPTVDERVGAFEKGWHNGMPCATSGYMPINPPGKYDPTAIESIKDHYGRDIDWCYFGADYGVFISCSNKHSIVRMEIDGNALRIRLVRANRVPAQGSFPPDYRGVSKGTLLFEGVSDKTTITGTFWYHRTGCSPVAYNVEGTVRLNNGLWLNGDLPVMRGCEVVGNIRALHFFRNVRDP